MSQAGTSNPQTTTLDDAWFKRYQEFKYSLADWYIAISRRYDIYTILNEYFQQASPKERESQPVLSHAGNKKFRWDDFISMHMEIPNEILLRTHVLLRTYLQHDCITEKIATQLRQEISSAQDKFDSFMQKLATMLVSVSNKDDEKNVAQIINNEKYKIHESDDFKTPEFLDELLLTMNNIDEYVDELKVHYFNRAKLTLMKDQILDGSILDIDDLERGIIYTDAPYRETHASKDTYLTFSRPIKTFTIFDIIRSKDKESEEKTSAVIQIFSEGEKHFLTRQMKEKMITDTKPDNSVKLPHADGIMTLSSDNENNNLRQQLQTYGWGKSKSGYKNKPDTIHQAVCSVDIRESDENLIYGFMLWLKFQRNNASTLDKEPDWLTAHEALNLVDNIQNAVKKLAADTEYVIQKIIECENYHLLCYLDYTMLNLLMEKPATLSATTLTSNPLCAEITTAEKAVKEKFSSLLRAVMSEDFLAEL